MYKQPNPETARAVSFLTETNNPWNTTPLTISLQLVQELFPAPSFAPASGLTLPLITLSFPKSYLVVMGVEWLVAFTVRYSLIHSDYYNALAYLLDQNYPGYLALRELYPVLSVASCFDSPVGENENSDARPSNTPFFPRGLAFNLSLSSPFRVPNSRSATIFFVKLFEIRNAPRFIIPLISLLIYWRGALAS